MRLLLLFAIFLTFVLVVCAEEETKQAAVAEVTKDAAKKSAEAVPAEDEHKIEKRRARAHRRNRRRQHRRRVNRKRRAHRRRFNRRQHPHRRG